MDVCNNRWCDVTDDVGYGGNSLQVGGSDFSLNAFTSKAESAACVVHQKVIAAVQSVRFFLQIFVMLELTRLGSQQIIQS